MGILKGGIQLASEGLYGYFMSPGQDQFSQFIVPQITMSMKKD